MNNTEKEKMSEINTKVKEALAKTDSKSEAGTWLASQSGVITEIVMRYIANPSMIEISDEASDEVKALREELRNNPVLVAELMALKADKLFEYQSNYNNVLHRLADGVKLDTAKLADDDIASALQEHTFANGQTKVEQAISTGKKVGVPMLGIGGTGKGTIIKLSGPRVVNTTTRARRPGEEVGVDYHYVEGVDVEGNDTNGSGENKYLAQGPFLADLIRPGRGRYGTTVAATKEAFEHSNIAFIEQSPGEVLNIAKNAPELLPELVLQPVCILPPGGGILELAARVIVRTYGDPTHKDPEVENRYSLNDSYLESTMGPGQITEVAETTLFATNPELGIVYIVNDDLKKAVSQVKNLLGLD